MSDYIFKGPAFYEEKDHSIFRGREKETADLFYLVDNNDFSVCYANSGEGKSSLINAGLQPIMRNKNLFPIHILFNESDFERMRINENGNIYFDQLVWGKIEEAVKYARISKLYQGKYNTLTIQCTSLECDNIAVQNTVWWKLRNNELRINAFECVTPVLIFDQFEEVFTRTNINWTNAFFCWLDKLYNDEFIDRKGGAMHKAKKFKILLSLRSDYVSELDYWCMNKYFIPPLKNNRYCLKPLTKRSAYDVVRQLDNLPYGIKEEELIKSAKVERSGEWSDIGDSLPCISALALSLVLTGLENGSVNVKDKLEEYVELGKEDTSKEFLYYLLNQIYENALEKSGIGKESTMRDTLEDSLVDTNGRKRVVTLLDKNLQSIPERIIRRLAQERIIVISGINVEISHDCLRTVIERHNLERQKRLTIEKRKNEILRKAAERSKYRAIRQKHTLLASIVLSMSFVASYLFLRFYAYSFIVPAFFGNGNLSKGDAIMCIPIACAIIIIPLFLTIFLYRRKWGKRHLLNLYTILSFLFFLLSAFIFYDLVNCPVKGYVSENIDSAYIFFLVPFFFFLTYQRKPKLHYWIYLFLLIPIDINGYEPFHIPFEIVILYMILASIYIIWSFVVCKTRIYNQRKRIYVKLLLIFANLFILWGTVFYQFGFNPIKVDYNQAIRNHKLSRKWNTIVVRDKAKFGLKDAWYGNILEPVVLDSIDKKNTNCHFYISDTIDIKHGQLGLYTIKKEFGKDALLVSYKIHPEYEYTINRYSLWKAPQGDSIRAKMFAAKVYLELKNEILNCLLGNKKMDIDNIPSIYPLDSIHKIKTKDILERVKKNKENLTDSEINILYRTIYTDLCLCLIKDRIIFHDLENVMTLFFIFQICEFQEELGKFSYHYNLVSNEEGIEYSINDKGLLGNFSSAYSNMLHLISSIDMSVHAPTIVDSLKNDFSRQQKLRDSIIKDMGIINVNNFYISVFAKIQKGIPVKAAMELTLHEFDGGMQKRINSFNELEDMFAFNYIESEGSFKQLADNVHNTLLPIVGNNNIYNSGLCNICREMAKISVCRWYDSCDEYVENIRKVENDRLDKTYKLTEDIVDAVKTYKNNYEKGRQEIDSVYKECRYKIEKFILQTE